MCWRYKLHFQSLSLAAIKVFDKSAGYENMEYHKYEDVWNITNQKHMEYEKYENVTTMNIILDLTTNAGPPIEDMDWRGGGMVRHHCTVHFIDLSGIWGEKIQSVNKLDASKYKVNKLRLNQIQKIELSNQKILDMSSRIRTPNL